MLKKRAIRKILITTASCFILFCLYLIPNKIDSNYLDIEKHVEYVSNTFNTEVYLLSNDNYLVKYDVMINSDDKIEKAKEIIEYLKIGSSKVIPKSLNRILNSDTKVNNIDIEDNILKIDFSEELLNTSKELEEKMIESLVYSLTSINDIDGIIIKVNNTPLERLPKNNKELVYPLNRKFGINKVYDINNRKNIQKVTIFYMENIANNNYYVPVTKYINDDREKINIIIDNLSSSYIYQDNLLSYLAKDVVLLDYQEKDDLLEVNFNKDIFQNEKMLESIQYTLSYSLFNNYDVDKLVILVNGEMKDEISKCVINNLCSKS